ncbi:MAG: hypothetical protein PHV34_22800 [Verrucomicrobiae bacterium]|nr:hypothetical protein [Verrucomicrobiae bacterium]
MFFEASADKIFHLTALDFIPQTRVNIRLEYHFFHAIPAKAHVCDKGIQSPLPPARAVFRRWLVQSQRRCH